MNLTIITVIGLGILGITKLLTYLLGDKRKLRILQQKEAELEKQLRTALAVNDTVAISSIELELNRVRAESSNIRGK